jgi:hypothetical protein
VRPFLEGFGQRDRQPQARQHGQQQHDRTGARSGSVQLAAQVVKIHTHHTARNSMVVSTSPRSPICASIVCESWVIAKT